eukprot:scaffold26581_cov60-Phaeocystis_antarctica.AAC.6
MLPTCACACGRCDEFDDGSAHLRVDYSIQCYAEGKGAYGEAYKGIMAYAILMSFIYPFGTPLLYAAVLYANRDAIAKVERLEGGLTSVNEVASNGKLRKEVNQKIRADNLGRGGITKLTDGYELRVYWFEVFECVRKICLIGLPIFIDPGSSAQLIAGLLVCFMSYGMYASYEPYVEKSDDQLSKVCQVSLFFSLVSSIALKMEPDDSADTLAGLLLFMLALPPMIAFLYQSDLDFEQGCHVSRVKTALLGLFHRTLGRYIKGMWGQQPKPPPAKAAAAKEAAASEVGGHEVVEGAKSLGRRRRRQRPVEEAHLGQLPVDGLQGGVELVVAAAPEAETVEERVI